MSLKQLEKVVERTRIAEFRQDNLPVPKEKEENKHNLLFFPRKMLGLSKANPSPESMSWLIEKRLPKTATSLGLPTEETGIGLTSGLRSGIIMGNKKDYLRLKGIAPITHYAQGNGRGLCANVEAFSEQRYAKMFQNDYLYPVMKPAFVEAIPRPIEDISPHAAFRHVKESEKIFYPGLGKNKEFLDFVSKFGDNFTFISAFKIYADTRLDESIYHLTKKRYYGNKKKERDDVLHYLSFFAGMAKAYFGNVGWSANLKHTNNHIGNFVVYTSAEGFIRVGMVDFTAVVTPAFFNPRFEEKTLDQYINDELESFEEDFHCGTACFGPTFLRYRHLPKDLAQSCFNALKTGYAVVRLRSRQKKGLVSYPIKLEKVVAPSAFYMTEDEFRTKCKKLMN